MLAPKIETMEPGAIRVGASDEPAFTMPPGGIVGPVWPDMAAQAHKIAPSILAVRIGRTKEDIGKLDTPAAKTVSLKNN
jgi:hypothetical protein